jgi:hypothetical protein
VTVAVGFFLILLVKKKKENAPIIDRPHNFGMKQEVARSAAIHRQKDHRQGRSLLIQ